MAVMANAGRSTSVRPRPPPCWGTLKAEHESSLMQAKSLPGVCTDRRAHSPRGLQAVGGNARNPCLEAVDWPRQMEHRARPDAHHLRSRDSLHTPSRRQWNSIWVRQLGGVLGVLDRKGGLEIRLAFCEWRQRDEYSLLVYRRYVQFGPSVLRLVVEACQLYR